MQEAFTDQGVFRSPESTHENLGPLKLILDAERPNWVVTDARGERILSLFNGRRTFTEAVRLYADEERLEPAKAWLQLSHFAKEALLHQMVSNNGAAPEQYLGRAFYLKPSGLKEMWFHLNNSCNLSCAHCLVSSGPNGEKGLPPDKIHSLVMEGYDLGVRRFFITGGEPFLRQDIFDLIHLVTVEKACEMVVLTNATLLQGERIEKLKVILHQGRLSLQISLDGATAETNDPLRGKGTYEKILAGIRNAKGIGFDVTVTVALTKQNTQDLTAMVELLASEKVFKLHLLYLHRRGRALEMNDVFPTNEEILNAIRKAKKRADELGVTIDNLESLKLKVNAPAGTKNDLSNAGWESLCVSYDGNVYPSAALSMTEELKCGDVREESLEDIYQNSPVLNELRNATVQAKPQCKACHLRFLCGGGDIEHGFYYSKGMTGKGSFLGFDPYCTLYQGLISDAFGELAAEKLKRENHKSGFDRPVVLRSMGEGAVVCGTEEAEGKTLLSTPQVKFSHSACVLSVDLVDASRQKVQAFYQEAGEKPQASLCCPVKYDDSDVTHIPKDVIDRFYGCGSPMADAQIKEGETVVDLGSGAGIDCFIAAKKVGAQGKVIGVDMTPAMRQVALENKPVVAKNLGFDVVEFREGYLENPPVESKTVDLITSNCVINLSPDKHKVFAEMWQMLKDHGRVVVADIVSEEPLPPHLSVNAHLWGECISGALTEQEFLDGLERAGFYGVSILKKTYWKTVEGFKFYSVTVRGYKFEKKEGCVYIGQRAVYLGPGKAFIDEEGHLFPRGVAIEVCTDTSSKLSNLPYAGHFAVLQPDQATPSFKADLSAGDASCCGTGGCC